MDDVFVRMEICCTDYFLQIILSEMLFENQTFPLEFQAVLLAGYGKKLYPLTEDKNAPKALLPVANKPMIYYALQWLQEAPVTDIIICCSQSNRTKLEDYLFKVYQTPTANIKLVDVPDDCTSCEALRLCKHFITTDFIVMPCDFMTEMKPNSLLHTHIARNATATCLLYDDTRLEVPQKEQQDREFIALDEKEGRLAMMKVRTKTDDLDVQVSLFRKFPQVSFYTQLRDSHVYVFKRWIMDHLIKQKHWHSIRQDLVPALLQYQHKVDLCKKDGVDKFVNQDPLLKARMMSTSGSHSQELVCLGIVHKDGFSARLNTIANYAEVNRWIVKSLSDQDRISQTSTVEPKTQVGQDSMVGEGTTIDERCSVKKTIIGNHCVIGKNVKMTNSIIMDYCTIEDGAKLENVIVCHRAKIETKANLKDCEVAGGAVVPSDAQIKGEVINK
ncbi:nucleotide-diphospho-sugar transferase [Gorgonomyces haynaldii]|nr:nucleotide-diphospho-sugar transferase [Gorgonomyces haynaldii]